MNSQDPFTLKSRHQCSPVITIGAFWYDLENLYLWVQHRPVEPLTRRVFTPFELFQIHFHYTQTLPPHFWCGHHKPEACYWRWQRDKWLRQLVPDSGFDWALLLAFGVLGLTLLQLF